MKKPFSEALKAHYRNIALTPKQLQRLKALQNQPKKSPTLTLRLCLGLAALFLLGYLSGFWMWQQKSLRTMCQNIAGEVAQNHRKDNPSTILAVSPELIQEGLPDLPFTLLASAIMEQHGFSLEGGRYCSIDGQLAAQLHYRKQVDKGRATLYQVELLPPWDNIPKQPSLWLDGQELVTLWREKNLLFAMVETKETEFTQP